MNKTEKIMPNQSQESFKIEATIDESNHLTNYGKSNPSILQENHWKI